MKIEHVVVPFAPEINSLRVAEGSIELYFLGRQFRTPKNGRGGGYLIFNILFSKGPDFRILIPGFRLIGGKILPPQARLFRQIFDHFYAGKSLRDLIWAGVNSFKDRLPLEPDVERATRALNLTQDTLTRYNKILEEEKEANIL